MNPDLRLDSYDFELDPSYIADRPTQKRSDAKLLIYNCKTDEVTHTTFSHLDEFLPKDSSIVFNNSKVFKARLLGTKSSGAKVEVFVLTLVENSRGFIHCLVKSARKKRVGDLLLLGDLKAEIKECLEDGTFYLEFDKRGEVFVDTVERLGKIPIPPYIRSGESDLNDVEDYQNIFAKEAGSVACPTAGLHFDDELLEKLSKRSISPAYVTLHVGLGTFLPVKSENILEHKMHCESYLIEKQELEKINNSSFVTAVGTTSLRVLESSYGKSIEANTLYDTDIFLYPGIEVNSIQALITNFHLPKSTLLMLVSSLIGREKTLELYEIAKQNQYRFFSYGDGMLILR